MHRATSGSMRKSWYASKKPHYPRRSIISYRMSVGRYRHQSTPCIFNQSLSALGKRLWPTERGIGQTTLVVDCRIDPCLCTFLKGGKAWTSRTDRGLCTKHSGHRACTSPVPIILHTTGSLCRTWATSIHRNIHIAEQTSSMKCSFGMWFVHISLPLWAWTSLFFLGVQRMVRIHKALPFPIDFDIHNDKTT